MILLELLGKFIFLMIAIALGFVVIGLLAIGGSILVRFWINRINPWLDEKIGPL